MLNVTEKIKVNDRVRVTFTLNENKRNERVIRDTGKVAFITKEGLLAIETDTLSPKIWYANIKDVVKL